ncbi:hypothetical protein LZ32DRAFT_455940 [Colletotrichum eremochloae]|nr:hypothetical protein LZ32DRAFT_455940 [Colletotrichum eremochloae]
MKDIDELRNLYMCFPLPGFRNNAILGFQTHAIWNVKGYSAHIHKLEPETHSFGTLGVLSLSLYLKKKKKKKKKGGKHLMQKTHLAAPPIDRYSNVPDVKLSVDLLDPTCSATLEFCGRIPNLSCHIQSTNRRQYPSRTHSWGSPATRIRDCGYAGDEFKSGMAPPQRTGAFSPHRSQTHQT